MGRKSEKHSDGGAPITGWGARETIDPEAQQHYHLAAVLSALFRGFASPRA
jgi:hypothetical protein